MFIDMLVDEIKKKNNPTVVGLDPNLKYIPESVKNKCFSEYGTTFQGAANAVLEFNLKIIDSICDIVPAVKLQLAYYEMYGIDGMNVFKDTVLYAKKKGLLVIADGKRNDIQATAEAYSSAYLGKVTICDDVQESVFDVDALTVNPYLGSDGINPFIADCQKYNKGIFILVKTSNPSSGELQNLNVSNNGKLVYETIADLVNEWGNNLIGKCGYSSVGAVVGGTYANQTKVLREKMKNTYILIPGYGVQGGTAEDVSKLFNEDGLGAIVNASRSIIYAYRLDETYGESNFAEASRKEAIKMRDDINKALIKRIT